MLKYEIEGYFNWYQCERIKAAMQGKTFMNFDIQYGGIADNNEIIVMSDNENYNDEELKEMFIHYALSLI